MFTCQALHVASAAKMRMFGSERGVSPLVLIGGHIQGLDTFRSPRSTQAVPVAWPAIPLPIHASHKTLSANSETRRGRTRADGGAGKGL